MTRSLERRLELALESVHIDAVLIHQGKPLGPLDRRLEFMASNLAEARDLLAKINRRDATRARAAARATTTERIA